MKFDYYYVSNVADDSDEANRTQLDERYSLEPELNRRFPLGVPIRNWRVPVISADRRAGLEDVPMGLSMKRPIVSEAFRKLIEREAPGAAQFLGIRLSYRGQRVNQAFWLCNWRRVIACADAGRTEWSYTPRTKRWIATTLVVARNKIPANARVFVAAESDELLVREDIKIAMEECGISGIWFARASMSDDVPRPPRQESKASVRRRCEEEVAREGVKRQRRLRVRGRLSVWYWMTESPVPYDDIRLPRRNDVERDDRLYVRLALSVQQRSLLSQEGRIERWTAPMCSVIDDDGRRPDVLITEGDAIVVSGRLRLLLEPIVDVEAQFLPIRMRARRPLAQKYWIMHPIKIASCIHEATTYGRNSAGLSYIRVLVLDRRGIPENAVFRLGRGIQGVVCHRRVVEALEQGGATGGSVIQLRLV